VRERYSTPAGLVYRSLTVAAPFHGSLTTTPKPDPAAPVNRFRLTVIRTGPYTVVSY
jgi:hypothetical protein